MRRTLAVSCRGWAVLLVLLAVGCDPPSQRRGFPGDRIVIEVNGERVYVEVACDGPSRSVGLMHRESLTESHGMLFIFPMSNKQRFWMKNTLLPLSIAFLDDDGTILQIEHMKPKDESGTLSINRVRYALEVNEGWFARNGVRVGDTFTDFKERVRSFDAS